MVLDKSLSRLNQRGPAFNFLLINIIDSGEKDVPKHYKLYDRDH